MKLLSKLTLINLFCFTTFTATADNSYTTQQMNQMNSSMQTLTQYLQYLGGYLGYDLTVSPTANNQTINNQLLSSSTTQLAQIYAYTNFIGAFPVVALNGVAAQILPSTVPLAEQLNRLANATFVYQQYSSASSSQQGKVSVNQSIDQQAYQQDPVSQSVLNILGTPDSSYYQATGTSTGSSLLYNNLVTANVIGPLPEPDSTPFFSYGYNQELLGQLNVNSLLGTLQFATENTNQSTGSPTESNQAPSLTAQNPAQQAANFIRYVTGSITPLQLPQKNDYETLYQQAYPVKGSNVTPQQQQQAQTTLYTYFGTLRTYAAQSSVGVSNLYFLLSKRLPQSQGQTQTSQAMSEFNMATWRLFRADMTQNKQWVNELNNASPATVEKEIATLLAEINYQMYLDRQIQERILLTNSIMLIQNTRASQPSASFTNQPNTTGGSSSSGATQ